MAFPLHLHRPGFLTQQEHLYGKLALNKSAFVMHNNAEDTCAFICIGENK